MRRGLPPLALAITLLVPCVAQGEDAAPSAPSASPAETKLDPSRGDAMRAYLGAMEKGRLGGAMPTQIDELRDTVKLAEEYTRTGRHFEAVTILVAIVEHPKFELFSETEEGRAAVFTLGDALASQGAFESARAYLRRALAQKGAWENRGTVARRSVKRLVEIALETGKLEDGLNDLAALPQAVPEEIKGEKVYLEGRAKEAANDAAGAKAAYALVPQVSRFWSQATYLQGLIAVESGKFKEGEDLFCKVADPKRQNKTTPVFADERFFAVRDLARLALGRVAHEQLRHDDARYYYYLVPRDSDRLAEALYESATTRYEKKDYQGARELLDDLNALKIHHRYEDEAVILDAYIDLALCRFESADQKIVAFIKRYEPVRDSIRTAGGNSRAVADLIALSEKRRPASENDTQGTIASILRIDPAYGTLSRRLATLERETGGLGGAAASLDAAAAGLLGKTVRPAVNPSASNAQKAEDVRTALGALRMRIDELDAMGKKEASELRKELGLLEARANEASRGRIPTENLSPGSELTDLVQRDTSLAQTLLVNAEEAKKELRAAQFALAKDALSRADMRLSRLLRRARLARIESVLGRKRALEVEIEAINDGYLPKDAVDSMQAARYLKDSEEYWPYEGDDWPDEFVGTEGLK